MKLKHYFCTALTDFLNTKAHLWTWSEVHE